MDPYLEISVKVFSTICDDKTDSCFQEAETVYACTCHRGQVSVKFSLLQNLNDGDANSVARR